MEQESPLNVDFTAGKVSPVGYSVNAKMRCLDSVLKDDRFEFLLHAKGLFLGEDTEPERIEALKLLSACCSNDSINCASAIIDGDVGSVPYIDDVCGDTGLSPLHTAAESHAGRCVEMLLKQRARTDMRSKDERALIPLELSLLSACFNVTWNPISDSIGDLILLLGHKDLTVVKLLAEQTKDVDMLAYAYAKSGAIVSLAALLTVATEKIREATVALRDDNDSVQNPTRKTIYEAVIHEALQNTSSKRIVLLREIDLLQLFGAAVFSEYVDNQTSPLISVVQAGDEAVLEMLLKTNIDVNETDAEGNTIIHCSLKGSLPHKHQTRIMQLLVAHGAPASQKNKLGLSALHFAAANGNLSALEVLLAANPKLVHVKTVTNETPLSFALKNNHLDCVELLLRYGASKEIHNLRKQSRKLPRTRDILKNEIKKSREWNSKFFEEHRMKRSVKNEINRTKPCSQISLHTDVDKAKGRFMLWEVGEKKPSEELFKENWKKSSGPVRNQKSHDICWGYSGTDLYSARRLLTKEDEKFRIFSAKYLAYYASPMLRYIESVDGYRKDKHHCHGYTIAKTLQFIKETGVPEEDPEDVEKGFSCISEPPEENLPDMYQLANDVEVRVSILLEDMYEMLLHQPVGADLHVFTPEFTEIGSGIYEGPKSDKCKYEGLHSVVITAIKRIKGKLVAIVKSSHGEKRGKKGYVKVSLTRMVLGVGRANEIYSPSFLLTNFTCPVIKAKKMGKKERRRARKRIMEEARKRRRENKERMEEDETKKRRM